MPLNFILPEAIQLADELEEKNQIGYTLQYQSTNDSKLRSIVS